MVRGEPARRPPILGRTVAGYLLVSVFFAYDVVLYLVMTKAFGWWSPADALVHPDVLATYAHGCRRSPNSFQAGFWEEALFRAVPLAGAALIGGPHRASSDACLVAGFVVQAIVFGSGHAPYPNQPAFARPVESIVPSIGFGLLYVYFGLLPGIILHFAFRRRLVRACPSSWRVHRGFGSNRLMILALTLVPLWIVLYRRLREGGWTDLPESERTRRGLLRHRGSTWSRCRVRGEMTSARACAGPGSVSVPAALLFCAFGVIRASVARAVRHPYPSPRRCFELLLDRAGRCSASPISPPGIDISRRRAGASCPTPDAGDAGGHEFVVEHPARAGGDRCSAPTSEAAMARYGSHRSKATSPSGRRNGT